MSAAPPARVAGAVKDALRASASASVAPTAASPALAAASSSPAPLPTVENELVSVKQRIEDNEKEIAAVAAQVAVAVSKRDACAVDDPRRLDFAADVPRLSRKEEQLREKEAQLREEAKELRAVLRQSVDRLADGVAGVHLAPPTTPTKAAASLLTFRSPPKRLDGVEVQPGVDPWLLQRLRLQEKVLQSGTRVLITAPPAAGKTSLIQLLAQHPRVANAKLLQLSTLGARQKLHEAGLPADLASVEALSAQEVADWWPLALQQPEDSALAHWDYIFIDDAQLLYGVASFWARVLKHPGRVSIFFFASTAMESLMLNTPAVPAKIGWEDFRLGVEEEDDLSMRITSRVQGHRPAVEAAWVVPMVDIVRKDACGHIGLFRCLLDHLLAFFPYTAKQPPTLQRVLRHYFGAMFDSWIAERFFQWAPPEPDHSETTVRLLRRIILGDRVPIAESQSAASGSAGSPASSPASMHLERVILRRLLRIPVLVDSAGCAQFATDLHRRFYLRQLYPSAVRSEEFVADMDEWLLQVLRTFEPSQLRDANSGGISSGFPKEGMLQHQFWRGACLCLPPQYRIAAEVSQLVQQGRSISGEVDFWINSDLEWAVELLRQGSGKGEHIARFKQNGAYRDLQPKQWRVVDFRPHETQPKREQDYVAVIFSPSYDRATVLLGTHRTEHIVLAGKYVPVGGASS